jgi:hypothetical protein
VNEHTFVKYVHRKLPPAVYRWKISDRFTSGIPDAWYSGTKGSIFVEYKYLQRTPKKKYANPLTALQRAWLTARVREGRTVAVAIGHPGGVYLLREPEQWTQDELQISQYMTRGDYIAWLVNQTVQ